MKQAIVLLGCYLLGSIPIGLIVGKALKGIDIRQHGSGNIGASNVLRLLGRGPAAVVFIGDTAKGILPVLVCGAVFHDPLLAVTGGILSVLGHNYSIFLKFQGGKGVATSLGVVIGIDPPIAAIAFGLWILILAACRYISVASPMAAISVPVQMLISGSFLNRSVPREYLAFGIVAALFVVLKHKSNYARLLSGTEPKIGQKLSTTGVSGFEQSGNPETG